MDSETLIWNLMGLNNQELGIGVQTLICKESLQKIINIIIIILRVPFWWQGVPVQRVDNRQFESSSMSMQGVFAQEQGSHGFQVLAGMAM